MNLKVMVLASAAFGIGAIAVGYLVAPQFMLSNYGISIDSINEASMIRSSYGGMFFAFAVLFTIGALKAEFSHAALLALLVFMAGFAGGRIISLMADGIPSLLVLGLLLLEVSYTLVTTYILVRERKTK
jgi:hypothetical protein